jgi:predicted  nucleic acid-binding Zn-ribbon protein
VKAELAQLIALQQADNRIKQLTANLNAIPQRRAEIEREFDERASEIKELEARRDAARQARRQFELEIEDNKTKAARAERNLMASRKTEDYTAAIREADIARKQIAKLEEQILEQMVAIEETDAALAERAPETERLRAELDTNLAAFAQLIKDEETELAQRRRERAQMQQEVPAATLKTYDRLVSRIRDGVAVAEVRNGACASCFMSVRPQALSDIRLGETVVTCEHCTRILFIETE